MIPLLCGLAANPALPADLLDRLTGLAGRVPDPDGELACALAERTDLTSGQVRALAANESAAIRLAHAGQLDPAGVDPLDRPPVALALLDEGLGLPEWARVLAAHPDRETRRQLASRPGLPLDVQETLAADPDVSVVAELGLWTTDPALAARLAAHPHAEVRMATALNEAVPSAALAALITGEGLAPALSCLVCDREEIPFTHDPHCPRRDCELPGGAACAGGHESTVHDTLQRAARNPATPTGVAAALAGHPSMLVRWALAERTDLPQELYARLAADPIPAVRLEVAGNPALGGPLIRAMAGDAARDAGVRRVLADHPNVPLDVLAELSRTVRLTGRPLPRVAAATPSELAELAASPHAAVRALAARSRSLSAEVRDALAGDPDAAVVACVAPHPGLSGVRLRAMVARHGVRVLARVAANPDASPALLTDLARHDPPVRRALREIAVHPNAPEAALLACLSEPRARADAARRPALSAPVLADLLAHGAPETAGAAAANPSLPRAAMAELLVRAEAEAEAGPDAGRTS
ncbi:hypothetical protein [Streptomyces sp. TBY4]|uniref:hypothetical protein n=1 Tax=Streptomyces sp. TBY4 TaxID=2962030 RepID=UPI0020B79EA4|nr:hypothetical protein [Streptomyces sp. TBY4]MCP3754800.1 hypothetical protein [Streptomyces sp. TBY4]